MNCFLCLQKSETVFDIYQGIEEGFILLNIPNIIEKHVCFQPNKGDPMLCNKCWGTIESFYIFCLTIKEAHKNVNEIKSSFSFENKLEITKEEYSIVNDDQNRSCDENESICDSTNNDNDNDSSFIPEEENNHNTNNVNDSKLTIRTKRKCTKKSTHKIELNKSQNEKKSILKDVEDKNEATIIKEKKTRTYITRNADSVDEKISKYMALSCDMCGEISPTLAALKTHFRIVHQQKGYAVCCGRKFKKRYLLIDHIDCHLNPDHFKCELCDKNFTVAESLKKHFKEIHENVNRMPFQCDQCSKQFMRKSILLRHKAYHLPAESWKFPCEECGKLFPSKYYLTSHKTFSHTSLPSKVCYICGKSVPTNRYKKHMRTHDSTKEEQKIECEICKAKLNKRYINVHRQHHTEAEKEEFFCPICNHKSPNRRALYIHTRYTHAEQRNHECHICHKTFKRKLSLRQHMGTHTGTNLYSCPYCPRTFTYDSNFYIHKKKEHPKEIEIEKQKQTRTNFTQHKEKAITKSNEQDNSNVVNEENELKAPSITIEDIKIEVYSTISENDFNNLE